MTTPLRFVLNTVLENSDKANPLLPLVEHLVKSDLTDEQIEPIIKLVDESIRTVSFSIPEPSRLKIVEMVLAANRDTRQLTPEAVLSSVNQLCYHLTRSVPVRRSKAVK